MLGTLTFWFKPSVYILSVLCTGSHFNWSYCRGSSLTLWNCGLLQLHLRWLSRRLPWDPPAAAHYPCWGFLLPVIRLQSFLCERYLADQVQKVQLSVQIIFYWLQQVKGCRCDKINWIWVVVFEAEGWVNKGRWINQVILSVLRQSLCSSGVRKLCGVIVILIVHLNCLFSASWTRLQDHTAWGM